MIRKLTILIIPFFLAGCATSQDINYLNSRIDRCWKFIGELENDISNEFSQLESEINEIMKSLENDRVEFDNFALPFKIRYLIQKIKDAKDYDMANLWLGELEKARENETNYLMRVLITSNIIALRMYLIDRFTNDR